MDFPKITLKGSHTTVSQLKQIGGRSKSILGLNYNCYYWLNTDGRIIQTCTLPEGYKLISHISELKPNKLFNLL